MYKGHKEVVAERQELAQKYGELYLKLVEGFYHADPMQMTQFGIPWNEYELEVGTVLPRLPACRSADDVEVVLWQELSKWFGSETLPPLWFMERLAVRVWGLVERYGTREAGFQKDQHAIEEGM